MKRNRLTDLCLKRPVTTFMVFAALLALGAASVFRIPLETYPELNYPQLNVNGSWQGASPEAMEAFITAPIEAEGNTLKGIEEVTSRSRQGQSTVTLKFAPEADMDFVQLELNEKMARLREELPSSARISVSQYVPPDVRQEFLLQYTFTGPYNVNRLRAFAEEHVRRPLAVVDGIAGVDVSGGEERQLQVILDEEKAEALGIRQAEVAAWLRRLDNVVETVGTATRGDYKYNLVVREDLGDLESLRATIVASRGNRFIRLGEIGQVVDGYADPRSYERLNGQDRVAIRVHAVAGSNIVDVAERATARIDELSQNLPPGIRLIQEQDNSEQIRRELEDLELRSGIILLLIFIVLLLFLRGIANPVIILSSIATSVLLTITIFYFLGGSLNMMSLAGLAMGFGMMVDNSIVVLDNIHRHRERGSGRLAAASIGTSEMVMPILAGTGTTIIVFIPFLYLQGELQALYMPFALAVATSLACSLLVSFTLIPSLAARALPAVREEAVPDPWALGELEREEEQGLKGGRGLGAGEAEHTLGLVDRFYQRFLRWVLGTWYRKTAAVVIVLGVGLLAWHGFDKYVTKGRIWRWGGTQEETLRVGVSAPTGSDLQVMSDLIAHFEEKLHPLYETGQVESYETFVTSENANITVRFPEEVIQQGLPYLVKDQMSVLAGWMGGVRTYISGFGDPFSAGGFGTGSSYGSRVTLLGYNYLELKRLAEEMARRATRHPRIREVDTNMSSYYGRGREKQLVLRFDRERMAGYGLNTSTAISLVTQYIYSEGSGNVMFRGDEVAFLVKTAGYNERQVDDLMDILLPTTAGGRVRLSEVALLDTEDVMSTIERKDQQYSRTVAWEFRGPYKMGENVKDEIKEAMVLPNGYEFDESDRLFQTEEERRQLMLVLLLAVMLVYMLTSALYESFLHPFTVIFTVPLALIGVFAGYFLFDKGFDQTAYVGVILMGGIVVNNAIILVDHINSLRRWLSRREAVVRAARERARPIIMTTITTVVGLLPLIVWADSTSDMWYTLAFTIVVALPVATFFTLTFIPLVYEAVDTVQLWVRRAIGALALSAQSGAVDRPSSRGPE
ncbi:MAG: efflux RND transporter permease subunit [bacterium]